MINKKLNTAILTGGNVAEREISLQSATTIFNHLDRNRYEKFIIELNGQNFQEQTTGALLDKNDFSLTTTAGKVRFDLVFLMLHGHPAEDGSIQGYFDLLDIPYTGCDHFVSALTFNKQVCKDFLARFNIPMAPSSLVRKGRKINWQDLKSMSLPVFVKPNKNGSSYGVSKVNSPNDLEPAIQLAFQYDDEIIVEGFLNGLEVSSGVFRKKDEIIALPLTEILPQNEFFDYKAKYENESQEITPARLSDKLTEQCQQQSRELYEILRCKGMVRFDYILVEDTFYFLEANTIPGMSENSIVPEQVKAAGMTLSRFLDAIVDEALFSRQ